MKRFLKSIVLFILPIGIIGICFEVLLRKIPNDYSLKRSVLDSSSKNIKALFLGNSHTFYGINPAQLKANSFNAAMTSQSLNVDLEILKKYNNLWDSLKFIIVTVDYITLSSTLENGPEAWRMKNYEIYYDINLTNSIGSRSEVLSFNLQHNIRRIYGFYIQNTSGVTSSKLGWGTKYKSKFNSNEDLLISGKRAAIKHYSKGEHDFIENYNVLISIIEFATVNKIKILFYTPPAYWTYVQELDPEQLHNTISTIEKLVKSKTNLFYFNFLSDKTFDKNDFYDADHLNDVGAGKLTHKIDSIINSIDNRLQY